MSSNKYKYWLDEPSVLYKESNYLNFIPTVTMTRVEQLNALARFCFYAIILLFAYDKNSKWFYIPMVILILSIVFYNIYQFDPKGKEKELYKEKQKRFGEAFNDGVTGNNAAGNPIEYQLETGFYDSNGDLVVAANYDTAPKNVNKIDYSLNEIQEYQKAVCRKPTKDNPFMNPPITDFGNGDIPVACNADDEDINQLMDEKFNEDIYRDIDDLFNVKNSQRQFYTVPATAIPNDQPEFAAWLWKQEDPCKDENGYGNCLRYEDLRYKR